jgi:hypothetical protein
MRSSTVALLAVLTLGCAAPPPDVAVDADSQTTVLPGGATLTTSAVTPAELDRIARSFAAAHRIDFDFTGTRAHVVIPRTRDHLATVSYENARDKVFTATIGFDRRVVDHRVATAVCNLGTR